MTKKIWHPVKQIVAGRDKFQTKEYVKGETLVVGLSNFMGRWFVQARNMQGRTVGRIVNRSYVTKAYAKKIADDFARYLAEEENSDGSV